MGDQCGTSNHKKKKKKKKKKKSEVEFCKACNINHDQGLRHKYFPNHKKSLSAFLSRFRNKLSHVRSILKSPNPLSLHLAPCNHFWCVFCDQDIHENSTSFPCDSAIRHLANADHVKNLKHFFWKYDGPVNQLDAFMVSDDEVAKWEKRCMAPKDGASEGSRRTVVGPSSSDDGMSICIRYPVQDSPESRMLLQKRALLQILMLCKILRLKGEIILSLMMVDNGQVMVTPIINRCMAMVECGESSHQGVQKITRISPTTKGAGGNVYDGEPPPWLEATEAVQMHSNPVVKSKKWNPNRVGAAWAEKRKIEREKEKRGEIVRNECDANWLPNFGRVWQSGSRRESRKEFEREKQKLNVETQSEMPIKIQPYVSKRMRMDDGGDYASR